ncbi:MAG TPA: hypothetical protein VFJ46_27240 [Xanthobacteraceae bacterium]|nr:hypothetical protein [Xanthobacteraceae bacterium]
MAGFVALPGDVLDSGTMSIEALHSFVRGWLASFDIIDRFLAYSTRHPLGPVQHDELEVRATQRRYRETDKDQIRERRRRKWESDEALRDRQRASNRAWQRRKRYQQVYGISLADYDAMLQRQGSACAICRRSCEAL